MNTVNKVFVVSDFLKKEYACEVVRIGELTPVEGSDFLAVTEIHPGMPIVVRKDEVNTGDIMFYVDMECQLAEKFLYVNNQYADSYLNANPDEKGFFNKNGRVRMVRLRGQESMGYLFSKASMDKYVSALGLPTDYRMEDLVGLVFDKVGDELFVQAYVPKINTPSEPRDKAGRRNKKLKRFDRLIPGEFSFHYDTDQLEKNIHKIKPDDVVDISIKMHGTSAIFANVHVKRELSVWEKIKKFFGCDVPLTEYGNIYSSRQVIKNQYINKEVTGGYYNEDIWGYWNERIKDFIPRGCTIYGEIVGFTPSGSPIQNTGGLFDYGCKPRQSKLMIYRVNTAEEDGTSKEWNISEVMGFTEALKDTITNAGHPEVADEILELPLVYHGTLHDLYPDFDVSEHWHENVLHALAAEPRFLMECDEPMCKNKVPREGLVIRIQDDPLKQAFKLKTMRFRNKEAKAIDNGQVDMEMMDAYTHNEE